MIVLSIDPGTEKCGYAIAEGPEVKIREKGVVQLSEFDAFFLRVMHTYEVDGIVLGNRTNSKKVKKILELKAKDLLNGKKMPINLIDEHNSTLEARRRYFGENPPRGIWRFVPIGLQTPGESYDDYVAVILAERFFSKMSYSL